LTADERSDSNEVETQKRVSFNADITAKLGDSVKLPSNPLPDWVEPDWDSEPYGDDTTSEHEPRVDEGRGRGRHDDVLLDLACSTEASG
jgi:hypothetical protein